MSLAKKGKARPGKGEGYAYSLPFREARQQDVLMGRVAPWKGCRTVDRESCVILGDVTS